MTDGNQLHLMPTHSQDSKPSLGKMMDASIINELSPTDSGGTSDPDMRPIKRGKQSHCKKTVHAGVEQGLDLAHTVASAVANVANLTQTKGCCIARLPHLR